MPSLTYAGWILPEFDWETILVHIDNSFDLDNNRRPDRRRETRDWSLIVDPWRPFVVASVPIGEAEENNCRIPEDRWILWFLYPTQQCHPDHFVYAPTTSAAMHGNIRRKSEIVSVVCCKCDWSVRRISLCNRSSPTDRRPCRWSKDDRDSPWQKRRHQMDERSSQNCRPLCTREHARLRSSRRHNERFEQYRVIYQPADWVVSACVVEQQPIDRSREFLRRKINTKCIDETVYKDEVLRWMKTNQSSVTLASVTDTIIAECNSRWSFLLVDQRHNLNRNWYFYKSMYLSVRQNLSARIDVETSIVSDNMWMSRVVVRWEEDPYLALWLDCCLVESDWNKCFVSMYPIERMLRESDGLEADSSFVAIALNRYRKTSRPIELETVGSDRIENKLGCLGLTFSNIRTDLSSLPMIFVQERRERAEGLIERKTSSWQADRYEWVQRSQLQQLEHGQSSSSFMRACIDASHVYGEPMNKYFPSLSLLFLCWPWCWRVNKTKREHAGREHEREILIPRMFAKEKFVDELFSFLHDILLSRCLTKERESATTEKICRANISFSLPRFFSISRGACRLWSLIYVCVCARVQNVSLAVVEEKERERRGKKIYDALEKHRRKK